MPDHKVLDKLDLVVHYIFQQTYRLQKLMRTGVDISRYRSERVNAAVLTLIVRQFTAAKRHTFCCSALSISCIVDFVGSLSSLELKVDDAALRKFAVNMTGVLSWNHGCCVSSTQSLHLHLST
jgi:hypothetical protein